MDVIEKEVLPSLHLAAGENLGIVTPYRRQAEALKQRFDQKQENIKSCLLYTSWQGLRSLY